MGRAFQNPLTHIRAILPGSTAWPLAALQFLFRVQNRDRAFIVVNPAAAIQRTLNAKAAPIFWVVLMLLGGGVSAPAQSFYGAYVSGLPQTSPKPTGGAFWATQLSSSSDTWSFTKMDFSLAPDGKTIVSSPRSGLVTGMKTVGPCKIYALGTAGVATDGKATTSAFSEGGFGKCVVGKTKFSLIAGFEVIQAAAAGGTERIIEIGFGRGAK